MGDVAAFLHISDFGQSIMKLRRPRNVQLIRLECEEMHFARDVKLHSRKQTIKKALIFMWPTSGRAQSTSVLHIGMRLYANYFCFIGGERNLVYL